MLYPEIEDRFNPENADVEWAYKSILTQFKDPILYS
jgi:hypothetical protein